MKQGAPKTLPARIYRDGSIYEIERRQIFSRSWLLVAHESQLRHCGEYVALTAAGYPLIVVRGDDGLVRAFHNVCRHRAGPFANDGLGRCDGKLVCQYHGWRYALDGRLSSARDFGAPEGFDPRDFALFRLKCELWRGFVFINMNLEAEPLAEYIAPLDARARHLPLEDFQFTTVTKHEIACNWKTYVENFLEAYHIPQIHPFLNSSIDATKFRIDIAPPAVFYQAPQSDGSPVSGLWAWIWPCLSVNVYNDGILMERSWPLSATETRLDYLYLFPEGVEPAVIERTIHASVTTTLEDKAICEAVQRNLNAGIFDTGCLSPRHELGVAWFQSELKRSIGD